MYHGETLGQIPGRVFFVLLPPAWILFYVHPQPVQLLLPPDYVLIVVALSDAATWQPTDLVDTP